MDVILCVSATVGSANTIVPLTVSIPVTVASSVTAPAEIGRGEIIVVAILLILPKIRAAHCEYRDRKDCGALR
jgi:hypothetical protein